MTGKACTRALLLLAPSLLTACDSSLARPPEGRGPGASTDIGWLGDRAEAGVTPAVDRGHASVDAGLDPGDARVLEGGALDAGTAAGTDWHPGHYLLLYVNAKQSALDQLAGQPYLRGAQVRYYWRDLEPSKGDYDLSRIASDLTYLQKMNKRLVIQILDKTFTNTPCVPDYVYQDPAYQGGAYEPQSKAKLCAARLWVPAVAERLVKLVKAIGAKLGDHPALEGVCGEETAMALDDPAPAGFSPKAYIDGMKTVLTGLRQAFSNKVVIQYMNYVPAGGGKLLAGLAQHAHAIGAGIGGPDIMPHKSATAYPYYAQYAGKMPLGAAVQYGGYNGDVTMEQIFDFGLDKLHLNYVFWLAHQGKQLKYNFADHALPLIKQRKGAINTACPTNIAPCVTHP